MLRPTAKGRSIQARNDRNINCFFSFSYVIQIGFGAGTIFAGVGKVRKRLGETLRAGPKMVFKLQGLLPQLVFE